MAFTVVPNDDGTINIKMPGSEEVTYTQDDVERCGLSQSEKSFLRSMLRHAVPDTTSCRINPK